MSVIYIRNKDGALVPFSSSDNCVKTVNGVEPDDNGNIQIIIPDSGGHVDLGVTGATVGQTIVVKAVDDNGKPTEWEAVYMPDSISIGMELGIINPVSNEHNVLFTDENGAICIL